jgi:hypothetical protein
MLEKDGHVIFLKWSPEVDLHSFLQAAHRGVCTMFTLWEEAHMPTLSGFRMKANMNYSSLLPPIKMDKSLPRILKQ